ncbi:hypothetical protein [Helicobacter typhlonius]|uniref:hypothetical protein n=1 Tax=Helicobacter typhlonius TaxID=76936 RepID=UPI002FE32B5B
MELKVINEITDEVKYFKSIEEFNLFYQKHKDDMNDQTTQYLNRVYKIITPEGMEYRITKKNCSKSGNRRVGGDIFLKKVVKTNDLKELKQDVIKAEIENLKSDIQNYDKQRKDQVLACEHKFATIDKKLAELTNTVNQIAKYINEQISQT